MTPLASKENLHPITLDEAEKVYQVSTMKLIRAAYLKRFTPFEAGRCTYKFPQFKNWWATLNDRQKERVKGVLAAEVLHMFRE